MTNPRIHERLYETSIGIVIATRPARPDDEDEMEEFEREFFYDDSEC